MKVASMAGLFAASASPLMAISRGKRDDYEPFHWARLKFKLLQNTPDKWDTHPWGDEFFLEMLHKRTSLNVDREWHVASLDHLDEMVQYPFLFMTSEQKFEFTQKQRQNFKEYLDRGGFIFADDCVVERTGDFFFQDFRRKIEDLFGEKMTRLPDDHDIYRCCYKLNGLPFLQGQNHGGWALFRNGRMAAFLTPTDIHCGWCSLKLQLSGQDAWFPKKNSVDAVKMGVNILVYALTH